MTLYEKIYKALKARIQRFNDITINDREFSIEILGHNEKYAYINLLINKARYEYQWRCFFFTSRLTETEYNNNIKQYTREIFIIIMRELSRDTRYYKSQENFDGYPYIKSFNDNGDLLGWHAVPIQDLE
jgi:hypothetical protein